MKPIERVRAACGETLGKVKDTVLRSNDSKKPQWDPGTLKAPVSVGDMLSRTEPGS